uniref:Uncharacterized protein n=1 Tax=Glossina austeni TaxID=7395 RepID=A0A1A9VUC9_GLOAU
MYESQTLYRRQLPVLQWPGPPPHFEVGNMMASESFTPVIVLGLHTGDDDNVAKNTDDIDEYRGQWCWRNNFKNLDKCRTEISINYNKNFADYGSLQLYEMKFWFMALAIVGVTISVNKG